MTALFDDGALKGDLTLGDRAHASAHRSRPEARPVRRRSRAKTSVLENLVLVALALALTVVTTIADLRRYWRLSPKCYGLEGDFFEKHLISHKASPVATVKRRGLTQVETPLRMLKPCLPTN